MNEYKVRRNVYIVNSSYNEFTIKADFFEVKDKIILFYLSPGTLIASFSLKFYNVIKVN